MRTVWLALLCLIGLATTVVVKIGMSPYASADVSRGVPSAKAEVSPETSPPDTVALSSENVTAGTNLQSDTLTKADKLEVSSTNEAAPEVKSVKSVAIVLRTTEPKQLSKKMERIVSRHWHDPFDKRTVQSAAKPPAKRKSSNASTNHSPIVTARAPKS
jgi:Flp pilus assembly protein CpaB